MEMKFENEGNVVRLGDNLLENIGRDIQVMARVVDTKDVEIFAKQLVIVCKDCGNEMRVVANTPLEQINIPKKCNRCSSKNIEVDKKRSEYEEFQYIVLADLDEENKRKILAVLPKEFVNSVEPEDIVRIEGYLDVEIKGKKRPKIKPILLVKRIYTIEKMRMHEILPKIKIMNMLLKIIEELQDIDEYGVPVDYIVEKIKSQYEISEDDVKRYLKKLTEEGHIYEPKLGYYRTI